MATRYVDGVAGNDANNGLAPVFDGVNGPKKTWTGVEATPVTANDTVHIKADVYRETLTVGVSGVAGQPIAYVGDYAGAIWPGAGGVVRITGSDNDQTAARASCIVASALRDYRAFRGFRMDTTSGWAISTNGGWAGTGWTIEDCTIQTGTAGSSGILINGANQAGWLIRRCLFEYAYAGTTGVIAGHTATVDNTGHVIENCIFPGGHNTYAMRSSSVGGVTIRNCYATGHLRAFAVIVALTAGQTITINNCIVQGNQVGMYATALGEITENYNSFFGNTTDRTNVGVGANSVTYPPLLDTRWFFEAVNGGRMVTPFDLGAWSQLINVAGTNPPATDLRGTAAIGGVREWGPLEYDPSLYIAGDDGCDYPLPADVEDGVVYGSGAYTGTLVCPSGGGGARPGCRWPDYKRRFDT